MGNVDPYEKLSNVRWQPLSGEEDLKPYPKGAKVPVVQRGFLITDKNGMLLPRTPKDAQVFSNLLNHAWKIWVIPELERRKESKKPAPYPLRKFIVLFDNEEGKPPTIKFNDEYQIKGSMIIKKGPAIKKGDPITFDRLADVGPMDPPMKNGDPLAFFIFRLDGKQISIYFDVRPNDQKFDKTLWKGEGKWLAEAYLETILAQQFGHLSLLIPMLSEHDTPFTIGLKGNKMRDLCGLVEVGLTKEELDRKLSRIIIRGDVEGLVRDWRSLDSFSDRSNILKEVSKSFKSGSYGGVILLLMSQIEGIITAKLISHNKGLKTGSKAKNWDKRVEEFEKLIENEGVGPLTLKILRGTIYFLNNSNLYKQFSWKDNNNRVSRHASIHGKDTSFNTRANAIRMILLFDALYWIFNYLSIARKEKTKV